MDYSSQSSYSKNHFSLAFLMQVVTGGSIFWGVLVVNPPVAIISAIIITPAIIRTVWVSDQMQFERLPFHWLDRLTVFARSIALVIVVSICSFLAFLAVCCVCGMVGFALGKTVGGYDKAATDLAAVCGVSGAIWGMGVASVLATYLLCRYWRPIWLLGSK